MLEILVRLASQLDELNLHKQSATVDLLVAKLAGKFNINDVAKMYDEQVKKKIQDFSEDDDTKSGYLEPEIEHRHQINQDKTHLLQDLLHGLTSSIDEKPTKIIDKSGSIEFFFRINFPEGKFIMVSIDDKAGSTFVKVYVKMYGLIHELIFPLNPRAPVGLPFVQTVVETVLAKINEDKQNS